MGICIETGKFCKYAPEEEIQNAPDEYFRGIYHDREQVFRHTPFSLEEKLVAQVASGDEIGAIETLRNIGKGEKATLAKDSVRSAKNSIICTCTFLARASIRAGVFPDDAFALSDACIREIEEFKTQREALGYEEKMLVQFVKLVKRSRTTGHPRPIQRAIHYIDSHLNQKVLLADIADYADIAPTYLSSLFNREMKISITDYVSLRKIQESTYFIRHKDYSVVDIAELYGFSSQSYYISLFKKIMGMTPGEYRIKLN